MRTQADVLRRGAWLSFHQSPQINDCTQAHQAMCGRRLTYSAEEHGWSAAAFHAQVDTYGAAVVLGRTAGGAVFGAYNPRGWIGKQFCIALHSDCAGPDLQARHEVSLTCVASCGISLEYAHTSLPDANRIYSAWQSVANGSQPYHGTL